MTETPRKSRLRLSLRALMILVLAVAIPMGWKANRARTQKRAVATILASGGDVDYDYAFSSQDLYNPMMNRVTKPRAPQWLRNIFGEEYFQEVTWVVISSPLTDDLLGSIENLDHIILLSINGNGLKIDEDAVARIARLPRLESLMIHQNGATDAGLARLADARKLRGLTLYNATAVTDAGLASLSGLTALEELTILDAPKITARGLKNLGPVLANLKTLMLYETDLSDEGMGCLAACRKLETVSLPNAKIGDAGLAHFRNMDALTKLFIGGTGITDEGLAVLGGLKNLRTLSLADTKVAGPGLASLEPLAGLEVLILINTGITDEAMVPIAKLKGLKNVIVRGTRVSPQAVAALQTQRPSLRIASGPMPPMPKPPTAKPAPAAK